MLSEAPPDETDDAVVHGLVTTVYSALGAQAVSAAADRAGVVAPVHVKVDTGMHRVGAEPERPGVGRATGVGRPRLHFAALWTHLAVSESTDLEDSAFTEGQLDRLDAARAELAAGGLPPPMVHAANSAAAIANVRSRLDLVRCGIALYGVLPDPAMGPALANAASGGEGLKPVMSLKARVSWVQELDAGERPSYGRRRPLEARSGVATIPIGYADGVPRRYFTAGGTVLIGGRRCRLAGTVTMDQIVVDCGPGAQVSIGDEVVLIGSQGTETRSAQDWADTLETIGYEVLCGIGRRVPRLMVDNASDEGGET